MQKKRRAKGGGGGRGYNSKKNPKRGGPGILLSCETGREVKCQREGMDILCYYYYQELKKGEALDGRSIGFVSEKPTNNEDDTKDATTKKDRKELSLEEEIAMLNSGISPDEVLQKSNDDIDNNNDKKMKKQSRGRQSGPFHVYETGCRGTVFIMYNPIANSGGLTSSSTSSAGEKCSNNETEQLKESSISTDECAVKRKSEEEKESETKLAAETITIKKKMKFTHDDASKNEKTESKTIDIDLITTTESNKDFPWDPLKATKAVIHDLQDGTIKKSNSCSIPNSRFVTRMIPMQTTCFASMDEIVATARSLLKSKLVPVGVEYNASKNLKSEQGGMGAESSLPTFKIDLHKRNCSNVKRNEIITKVADLVSILTKEALEKGSSSTSTTRPSDSLKTSNKETKSFSSLTSTSNNKAVDKNKNESQALFGVNLTNPDYTILIEICRTLCGISVVPNANEYSNFNLMTIKEKLKDDKD